MIQDPCIHTLGWLWQMWEWEERNERREEDTKIIYEQQYIGWIEFERAFSIYSYRLAHSISSAQAILTSLPTSHSPKLSRSIKCESKLFRTCSSSVYTISRQNCSLTLRMRMCVLCIGGTGTYEVALKSLESVLRCLCV